MNKWVAVASSLLIAAAKSLSKIKVIHVQFRKSKDSTKLGTKYSNSLLSLSFPLPETTISPLLADYFDI